MYYLKHTFLALLIILNAFTSNAQAVNKKITGKYADGISELILKPDSSFNLITPDYVFPYTAAIYNNHGKWQAIGNVIMLNPDKERRKPKVTMSERVIDDFDSIKIKINYLTEVFENEIRVGIVRADFGLISLYLNKPKYFQNYVHPTIRGASASLYAFTHKNKKSITLDSSSTIKLKKQYIERLGIYTYGFSKAIELLPINPKANYFEITITQPIDKERMPRSKKVIIKDYYAYFYELNDRVPTSRLTLNGLKKVL